MCVAISMGMSVNSMSDFDDGSGNAVARSKLSQSLVRYDVLLLCQRLGLVSEDRHSF